MNEKEINKILKPKKKLVFLLLIYLSIAFVCIGLVFVKFAKSEEPINLAELVSSGTEKEEQFVKLDIAYLPKLLATTAEKDNYLYFVTDTDNRIYIVRLFNKTFEKIKEISNEETGKLDSAYQVKGLTCNIDEKVKQLALRESKKISMEKELNSDNFSEYLGKVYVEERNTPESDRNITLYTISALAGVFFLVVALGYILPGILKARKTANNKQLVDELRVELENLTDMPYKKYHLYLTNKYVISGIQVIKYEDIVWAYILGESKYGIKVGENLIVHTKDNKRHTIGSVTGNDNILDDILADLYNRNTNIKVGYNDENKNLFQ